jgi:hypothetical protein
MGIPGFFKQNKPRGFNYIPRYYDPVKEEWEKRRAQNAASRAQDPDQEGESSSSPADAAEGKQPYRSKIMRGDMKNYFHRRKERMEKHNIIRLLVIILIIILVVYIYLRF